jgi:hypothetical protein
MTQEEKTSLCENIVKKGISFYKENLKQFSTYEKWKQLSEIYSFCFGEQMHKEEELGYKIDEPVWLKADDKIVAFCITNGMIAL